MRDGAERALVAAGSVAGLAGVGLSAVAAHATGPGSLDVAARFLLVHAPVLVGLAPLLRLGLVARAGGFAAGLALGLGCCLFCGDLTVRALAGRAPFPMAAPVGGSLLAAGWLALALSAAIRPGPGRAASES